MSLRQTCILLLSTFVCGSPTLHSQTFFESVGGGFSNAVRNFTLSTDSTQLIAVGNFAWVRIDSMRANGLAQWDGQAWDIAPFAGGSGDTSAYGYENTPVLSVEVFHDTVFISFLGSNWQLDPDIATSAFLANGIWHQCGNPYSLTFMLQENNRLFTGNQLDSVNNVAALGIHEWLGGQWRELPNSPFVASAGIYGSTYWNNQYYFAGIFQALGSRKIIAFDGDSTWTPLGSGILGSHLNVVEGHGDSLYVGGFFQNPSQHIAIWDGNEWHPFFPEVEYIGQVTGIKSYNESLYISGVYHFVGDTTLYAVLRWDGHSLCALGGPLGADLGLGFEIFQDQIYTSMAPTYTPLYQQYIAKLPLENIVPFACVVPSLVSVRENETTTGELSIFPNPASSSVNISFPAGVIGQRIEISNALGQVIYSEPVSGFNSQISLKQVAFGVYQVTAYSNEGRYFSRMLVE